MLEANTAIVSLFKGICAADWVTYDIDDTTSLTRALRTVHRQFSQTIITIERDARRRMR